MLAAIPTALSVGLEWSGVVDPTNVGRALCALPLGATAAWVFVQSLRGEELANRDSKKTDMITEVVSKPSRNDPANERASEPTRAASARRATAPKAERLIQEDVAPARRSLGEGGSERAGESERRSPSERR